MECSKITFTDFSENYSFSIDLVSHFTTIIGYNSGEGKTWLFDSVSRKRVAGELHIACEYDVIFSTLESLDRDLSIETRMVIIVDEYTVSKSQTIINKINNCKHLIVAITRASLTKVNSPLNGIYQIIATEDSVFDVQKINESKPLPLTRELSNIDIILTEAAECKSEHQFISNLCKLTDKKLEVIAASGKDNVAKKLRTLSKERPNDKILVFTDLGNISSQIKLLSKRCKDNPNIKIFDYTCFEELLSESDLFKKFLFDFKETVFDFLTPERYYEKKLEVITKNTRYYYTHEKPILSMCYLIYCLNCSDVCELYDENKFKNLLSSEIGKAIYNSFFNTVELKDKEEIGVSNRVDVTMTPMNYF